nr:LuxR family transcriptional regulator [Legionella jordanis]
MDKLLNEFERAHTLNQLNDALMQFFYSQGIQSIAVTYYQQHTKTGSKLIYNWVSPALKIWHEFYLDQGYADVDRTLEETEQSLIPQFWDINQQLTQAKNKRELRMRQESKEFGVDKGLSLPIYGPAGEFVVLVLHQRQGENGLLNWQQKQYVWLAISQCYFHFLRRTLVRDVKKGVKLTRREQQCLKLTAENLRLEAIANQLGVSQRTIHYHLQNANKKLGVNNKYLAAMRWLQEN